MKKMIILLLAILVCRPVLATMSSTIARESLFTGDGSTTAFAFTFPIVNTSDIEVWLRTTATGAQTQQTETTHYSVSATNNNYTSGGTVTMVTAPASTQKLLILRATPQTQLGDIGSSGVLLTLENNDDKLQRQLIDLQEEVNRCLKFPKTDATTLSSAIDDSVSRASQGLGFTSTGEPTVLSSGLDVGTVTATAFGQSLVDDSDAAEARGTLGIDTTDAVEFAGITGTTGTFSGALSATTGTFSSGVSGTTGTFSGALSATTGTFSGTITANAGVTLGAGDDLIGSSTSDITFNTNKFTVAGATGNTIIAGTLGVTGVATIGDGSLLATSAAPSTDAMIANKKYVDDQIGATYSGGESHTFSGGLILKQGVENVANDTTDDVTYAVAFPTNCLWAQATFKSNANTIAEPAVAIPKSGSTSTILQVTNCTSSTLDIYWQAWGY